MLMKSAIKNSVLVVADQALLSFHMTNVYRSKVFFLKSVYAGRGQVLIALAKLSESLFVLLFRPALSYVFGAYAVNKIRL